MYLVIGSSYLKRFKREFTVDFDFKVIAKIYEWKQ